MLEVKTPQKSYHTESFVVKNDAGFVTLRCPFYTYSDGLPHNLVNIVNILSNFGMLQDILLYIAYSIFI